MFIIGDTIADLGFAEQPDPRSLGSVTDKAKTQNLTGVRVKAQDLSLLRFGEGICLFVMVFFFP